MVGELAGRDAQGDDLSNICARLTTTDAMRSANGSVGGAACGTSRSLPMLSTTVTKSDLRHGSAERPNGPTVRPLGDRDDGGRGNVSEIIALAAAMILRRVSAARRLRPSDGDWVLCA